MSPFISPYLKQNYHILKDRLVNTPVISMMTC